MDGTEFIGPFRKAGVQKEKEKTYLNTSQYLNMLKTKNNKNGAGGTYTIFNSNVFIRTGLNFRLVTPFFTVTAKSA